MNLKGFIDGGSSPLGVESIGRSIHVIEDGESFQGNNINAGVVSSSETFLGEQTITVEVKSGPRYDQSGHREHSVTFLLGKIKYRVFDDNEGSSIFATKLVIERALLGKSIREVAAHLNMTATGLRSIEEGRSAASETEVNVLSTYYGLDSALYNMDRHCRDKPVQAFELTEQMIKLARAT